MVVNGTGCASYCTHRPGQRAHESRNQMFMGFPGEPDLARERTMTSSSTTRHLTELTDASFSSEVLGSDQPVLVDFYADWCPPCKMLAPILEGVAGQVGDEAVLGKVNVDRNPQVAQRYNIASLPTVLVFRNGQEVDRMIGVQPGQRYVSALTSPA